MLASVHMLACDRTLSWTCREFAAEKDEAAALFACKGLLGEHYVFKSLIMTSHDFEEGITSYTNV